MTINSGYENCEALPMPHVALFLPFIIRELDIEFLIRKRVKFQLSELDIQMAKQAWQDDEVEDDERTRNIYLFLMNLFQGPSGAWVSQALALWYLNEGKHDVAKVMTFSPDHVHPDAFQVYHDKIVTHRCHDLILRIAGMLPVEMLAEKYVRNSGCPVYAEIGKEIKKLLSQDSSLLGLWTARCLILIRTITAQSKRHAPENWFNAFMLLLSYHPRTRALAKFLDPQFASTIEEYQVYLNTSIAGKNDERFKDIIDVNEPPPSEPRPQTLSIFGPRPERITGDISPSTYTLYSYQEELVMKPIQGINSVICAPTGSGKTIVASEIILKHLRNKRMMNKTGRVVMFVPSVPLVNQQSEVLNRHLTPEFYVTKMSGAEKESSTDPLLYIMAGDVVVITPQMFINMVDSPLRSQKLYISDFTLMIFDECHHCDENHPYMVLMDKVMKIQTKPQIVGLTASVGTGKTNKNLSPNVAMEHILALCARMNAATISSVKNPSNVRELRQRVSQPMDEFYAVRPKDVDKFSLVVAQMCDYVFREIKPDLLRYSKQLLQLTADKIELPMVGLNDQNGVSKANPKFYHMLAYLKHQVRLKAAPGFKACRLMLLKGLTMMEICYFTIKYNELFPATLALTYMNSRLEEFKRDELFYHNESAAPSGFDLERLRMIHRYLSRSAEDLQLYTADSANKPILQKLIDVLIQQFHRDPRSRIIIFVEMRRVCANLHEYLKTHPNIRRSFGTDKVGYIASTNASQNNDGQSAMEQGDMLDKFRSGKINILVATAVAEEGLDVPTCNLVVKYNSVGSEVAYTQRKGRARALNSRAVLLALDEDVETKELVNIRREYLMNACMETLQSMHEDELQCKIKEQVEKRQLQQAEIARRESEQLQALSRNYDLKCNQCSRSIAASKELHKLGNDRVICCNPLCWNGTRVERNKSANENDTALSCGTWLCGCGQKRGEIIKYGETFLPTLSASCFTLTRDDGHLISNAKNVKWSIIERQFFRITPISPTDIRLMVTTLHDASEELFKTVEQFEKIQLNEMLNRPARAVKPKVERLKD